jgi:hypothetical protein
VFEAFRNWLSWRTPKGRTQANDIATQSFKLTSEFALLIATYPIEFANAALLPAPKEAMRMAFRIVWAISNQEMRSMAEVLYPQLFRFQDGVGVVPVSPELPPDADPATAHEKLAAFLAWADKTKAEADELLADVQDWKQNGPPPPS